MMMVIVCFNELLVMHKVCATIMLLQCGEDNDVGDNRGDGDMVITILYDGDSCQNYVESSSDNHNGDSHGVIAGDCDDHHQNYFKLW